MAAPRRYRLIDAALQPHPHLDDEYSSLPDALETAIHWSRLLAFDPIQASIGVEVSTASGGWRTLQYPTTATAVSIPDVVRSNC